MPLTSGGGPAPHGRQAPGLRFAGEEEEEGEEARPRPLSLMEAACWLEGCRLRVPVTQRLLGCPQGPFVQPEDGTSCTPVSCHRTQQQPLKTPWGGSPQSPRAWGEGSQAPRDVALSGGGLALSPWGPKPGGGGAPTWGWAGVFWGEQGSDVPCRRPGGAFMSLPVPRPPGCGTTNTNTKKKKKKKPSRIIHVSLKTLCDKRH